MPFSGFLHGIEIIETTIGPIPVVVVRSGVVGLVGTAPTFAGSTRPPWYTPPVNGVVPSWCDGDGKLASFPLWNQGAVYVKNECVVDANGNVQQVTVAGTSGASQPTWDTDVGDTTTDNTVTWKLVQTAAQFGRLNQLQLVSGSSGAAGFGPRVRGYTIPYALRAIQLQGAAQVIVVNVFDWNAHVTAHSASYTFATIGGRQQVKLGHMGVSDVVISGSVLKTDFTVDQVNGVVYLPVPVGNIAENATKTIAFNFADPAGGACVVNDDVIGDAGPPATGLELLPFSIAKFGFNPKILIAPGFSYVKAVADEMLSIAGKVKGVACIDSPGGLSPESGGSSAPPVSTTVLVQTPNVTDTIANRSDLAAAFSLSDERAILVYPNQMFSDAGKDPASLEVFQPVDGPYSAFYAGAMAANDIKFGYWFSPSNIQVIGLLGPDVQFIMSATDPFSDSNSLNAAGIVAVFSAFGTGLRAWGNRSSAFPAASDPKTFIAVRRTLDVVEESLDAFSLQYLDKPISNALIQTVLQSANGFVRLLIQRGALVPGSHVTFNPDSNPAVELAAGHITFDVDLIPPPPAERITYNFFVDTNLLGNITGK